MGRRRRPRGDRRRRALGDAASAADRIVAEVVATTRALRDNGLFVRIVELDAELLLPYLLTRRGRSQEAIAELTAGASARGSRTAASATATRSRSPGPCCSPPTGSCCSAHTMVDDEVGEDDLDGELEHLVAAVVAPMTRGRIRAGLAERPDARSTSSSSGLGVTGAGVALDAVSRGLSVLAVDAHDLAFGTSRWSRKLVHGGLRYLANGQVGVAHESAVERGILMEVTAPHLTHALPMLLPLDGPRRPRARRRSLRAGLRAGDLLRVAARTSRETLPRPAALSAHREPLDLAPVLRRRRCAAACSPGTASSRTTRAWSSRSRARRPRLRRPGPHPRPGRRAATATAPTLRDELTGETHDVGARAVVNAAGVWAGDLVDDVELRPSRGTHLVLGALPGLRVALTLPVPGERNRFLNVVPQPEGLVYVGLTDVPVDGRGARRPGADRGRDRLPVDDHVRGPRPPAEPRRRRRRVRRAAAAAARRRRATSDLSRRHAVLSRSTAS